MEVLQILKFIYRQERLDFSSDWISKEQDLNDISVGTEQARELMMSGNLDKLVELLNGGVSNPS